MIDFDLPLNRRNTNTWKWDGEGKGAQFPMGTADMDFRMPEEIRAAIHEKVDQCILSYACDKSYFGKAFAKYQKKRYGLDIKPEEVMPGTALMAVFKVILEAFTAAGDGVIVQTPVFGPIYTVTKNNGRMLFDNALLYNREEGAWSINFEELEEMAKNPRVRMLVICNPGNPCTRGFTKEEMQRMYDICNANDVIVLSDEIHSDVYYDGRKHVSILSVCDAEKNNCVVLTSSGKVFGVPGLKTAAVVIQNKKLRDRYGIASTNARMDVVDLGLVASTAGYEHCEGYILELQQYLQKNKDYIVDWFAKNDIKVKLTKPEASYLFWLDFQDWKMNCQELTDLLGEYGIVFSAGDEFGGDHNEGFMRMNIATRYEQVVGALEQLKKCYEEKIK